MAGSEQRQAAVHQYVVVSDSMIIEMVGLWQVFKPEGCSLNQLHKALMRVRIGTQLVQWYRLRDATSRLVDEGHLMLEPYTPKRKLYGLEGWNLYTLPDWGSWWSSRIPQDGFTVQSQTDQERKRKLAAVRMGEGE